MLGITIGIFAITIIFTLVNTLESAIAGNLAKLGNTVMFVHNWPWAQNDDDWFKYIGRPKMSYNDYRWLRDNLENVDAVTYEISTNDQTVKAGKNTIEGVELQGVTHENIVVFPREFQEGRYFSPIEVEAGRNVCIIGAKIAEILFEGDAAVGRDVTVRGKRLRVIGVFKKEGENPLGRSSDQLFMMPYPIMQRMFNERNRGVDKLVSVRAVSYEMVPKVENDIIGIMRRARSLKPKQEDDFSINKQEMLIESLGNIMKYLRIGGGFISVLALIVGGIGIANIMFVSVKERTREIGIQKALGARKPFILSQFLYEAVILCIIGGLMGIALTGGFAFLAQVIIDNIGMAVEVTVKAGDVILGIFISVVIGLAFGFLPAYFASKLDPVEAMRK